MTITEVKSKYCISCKYYAQGKTCSFCANEKQPDDSLKQYAYYNFSCDLHEDGIHQTRIEYINECTNRL